MRALAEILRFYPAFVNQRVQAVIGLAQGDAQFGGELALGQLRVGGDGFEEFVFCKKVQGSRLKVQGSRKKGKGKGARFKNFWIGWIL